MTTVTATITVEREVPNGEDFDYIKTEVELEGRFEYYGSYNPHERGMHLADFDVVSPAGFQLTKEEDERAAQALYDNL